MEEVLGVLEESETKCKVIRRTVELEMDMGGRQVWAWLGWTAEEARVSGDGWV